jgi:DNA-binding transcriptional ArsR family regulator
MLEDQVLDRTYAALADPTRRALLIALRNGESRITDLASPLPMTFAGVSRHIGVLESAGLVQRTVRGRNHWLSLRPAALDPAQQWIAEQTILWSSRAMPLALGWNASVQAHEHPRGGKRHRRTTASGHTR